MKRNEHSVLAVHRHLGLTKLPSLVRSAFTVRPLAIGNAERWSRIPGC